MANQTKTKATKTPATPKRAPAPKRDESRAALLARTIATVDLDIDGRILGASEAFLDIVAREESDIAHRALAAFFCPVFAKSALADAALSTFQKALTGADPTPCLVHLTSVGAGVRVVQLSFVAVGTGRARRVVAQGVDVTALSGQAEKAQAAVADIDARGELVFRAAEGAFWHSKLTYPFGDPRNEVWASHDFCRILGVSNDDPGAALAGLTGRLPPESTAELLKQFDAHTNDRTGRTGFNLEHPFRMENGEYRWYRSVLTTRRDANGTPIAQAGVLEDIHERKMAALELERTLARSELINKAAGVGLWDMSVIAGDPVNPKNEFWWSDQFRSMLGFQGERDFPNVLESWSSRLHPDHADKVITAFAGHLNDHSGKTPYDIEYLLQLKNGTYRWFRATGATVRDAKGVPLRVAGALKDIDEEKRVALTLERALSRADLINKASNVGLWDMVVIAGDPVNPKNEFWWSDQFRSMLGFESERDFPNVLEAWSTRIHPEESDRVLNAFAAHLTDHSGKTPYDIEYRLKLRNGEYRWFRATGSTTRDAHGIPLRVAGALKEINDEKETALALENLVAAAVAGDLTQRIATDKMSGMSKTIGDKMNGLLESVADSFRTVKIAIEQVGQASSQLRATSQMMSQSSLELNEGVDRSSSELSRVADGVRANAANASMANQLVTQTSVAGKSGEARMEEMSSAMGAINSSAAQIARIIKVIDEIAFQTNLLALNAAVEAARAGRHGKGFAVVAQEVRNLAERSARAAKETAELIEDSTAKVGQGVRIADGTREALREIVGNVTKVVDLAGEIATASGEQSTALASVSTSMKQATAAAQAGSQQSNEVAAASDELSRQMKVLNDQMAKYRLGTRATPNLVGLPAGATPELIDQILASIRNNAGFARQEQRAHNVEPLFREERPMKATGTGDADPRSVLPLDRDERGFGQF